MRTLRVLLHILVVVSAAGLFCSALALIFDLYPIDPWVVVASGTATMITSASMLLTEPAPGDDCACEDCEQHRADLAAERARIERAREEWS